MYAILVLKYCNNFIEMMNFVALLYKLNKRTNVTEENQLCS